MGITYCTTCIGFAVSWTGVKDTGVLADLERSSTQALFGMHVAYAHVEAETPAPVPSCRDCRDLASYVATHGEDSVAPGGCTTTTGQLQRQHLLGHLLPQVPIPA